MKREFDSLAHLPVHRITASPAALAQIPEVVRRAAREIPALAAAEAAVARVQGKDPESVWAFWRGDNLVGLYAMLMLNADGLDRLLAGSFDFAEPPLDGLSEPDTPVVAIYKWAVVARGTAAEGIRAMSRLLQQPRYARANLYARALGEAAQRLDFNLGFRPVHPGSELLVYVRRCNRDPRHLIAA